MGKDDIREKILSVGADPEKPWVAVNFHQWGQGEDADRDRIANRFADICDLLSSKFELQPIFIAMTPSDVGPEKMVIARMKETGFALPYSPDYKVVRGVIADSLFCFTMKHHPIVFAQGEGVPVVSLALDDYYRHKNLGALANTGHERFLIDSEAFYSKEVIRIFEEVLEHRTSINAELNEWTREMKKRELSVYKQMLQEIG